MLVELAPCDSRTRRRVELLRDWRDTIWAQPSTWGSLTAELNEALAHKCLDLAPGWTGMRGRFKLEKFYDDSRSRWALPPMDLTVTHPATIDIVNFRPGSDDHWDWTDVLNEFERAERAVEARPWLARWKQEVRGQIAVSVPYRDDPLSGWTHVKRTMWKEAAMEGTPELALDFLCRWPEAPAQTGVLCGRGLLSEAGDLLI